MRRNLGLVRWNALAVGIHPTNGTKRFQSIILVHPLYRIPSLRTPNSSIETGVKESQDQIPIILSPGLFESDPIPFSESP
ncbi:hypothetical protein CEXT_305131 [Caerostris extrusa]|uniref:Uncharacterized protein n=1 Tax=Caerostris extrusa TaxID=172846 RepID=A0AAV4NY39_CAEEX|nr:hypothetical protein CEXT_305131 [Caerostris extrusa]